jgi:hypothetical protein
VSQDLPTALENRVGQVCGAVLLSSVKVTSTTVRIYTSRSVTCGVTGLSTYPEQSSASTLPHGNYS